MTTQAPTRKTTRVAAPDATIPRLTRVRQRFPRPRVEDVSAAVDAAIGSISTGIQPGWRVAVTGGSRGIANIREILRAVVGRLKEMGAHPFVVPAMGSHGGGTAEGQVEMLASYELTEAALGCPILATMEVVEVPGPTDFPVYMDRYAWEADAVVVVNRIKPHTDFHDRYESGLVKMAVIGLGKAVQAAEIHRHGVRGLRELLPVAGRSILESGKIAFGLAIVENAYDETMHVEAIPASGILEREPTLLEMARENMPRLPVDELDVLVIDRMGKNISGAGMDSNVIGRMYITGEPEPERPRIKMIVVSDLTEESHGNAAGVGFADICTRSLLDKIDFVKTNTNVVTSTFYIRGKLPMIAGNTREAYEWAIRGCLPIPPGEERIARILDTLHVAELQVSAAVLRDIQHRDDIEILGEPEEWLDSDGELLDW